MARRLPPFCMGLIPFIPLFLAACGDDSGTPPGSLRFGQLGEVKVSVIASRGSGEGELQQILTWGSSGAWVLREIISYEGRVGDETVRKNEGDPRAYGSAYASLITQLNETNGIKLFVPELPTGLPEPCPLGWTEVSVSIWDDFREEEESWTRCAQGSLATLKTSEAGPDLFAGRVIQAALLVRDFTQGSQFTSAYVGSIPFGTLDRGEDSGARLEGPTKFLSVPAGSSQTPTGWVAFWKAHKGSQQAQPPEVDWTREMVLVAAVGERSEAGDSVEIRRILQTGDGSQVTLVERQPGDFCSPAARDHFPIHIVVAPRTLEPIRFSEVVTDRVPCGI